MNSIKHKLMLISSIIALVFIATFVLFSAYLIEPIYDYSFKKELNIKMEKIEKIFLDIPLSDWIEGEVNIDRVKNILSDGNCLDVAHVKIPAFNGLSIAYARLATLEGIGNCELHSIQSFSRGSIEDTEVVSAYRTYIAQNGYVMEVSPKGGQLIVGKLLENGYILTLSGSISQVDIVSNFFVKCIMFLSLFLVPIILVICYIASQSFTKPIIRLRKATQKMAAGNYEINLPITTSDEIGGLVQDFNNMAYQVNKSDKLQKELISNISHDLRTPLTLVKGYAETIRDLNGDIKEKRDKQLNIIIDETDRLSALVNTVLVLGKLSSGVQKPELYEFDLFDFCEELIETYKDICLKKGHTLIIENSVKNTTVNADPQLLGRALHNLISNGLSHIGEDNILRLKLSNVNKGILVEVIDNGEGISQEECAYVFDKYYRSRKNKGRVGTGLGLSIVKAIMQAHNFEFGVKSEVGTGSNFWFIINLSL